MTITAAADGSALGNPGPAGWAWVIDDTQWRAGGWPRATNNQGELMAVLDLLRETAHVASAPLHVLCDSQYVINSITKWMPGWKRKGWRKADGKPVLNLELLKELDEALRGRTVTFEWVKGHAGHPLNEAADSRARAAATAFQNRSAPNEGPGFAGFAPTSSSATQATALVAPTLPAQPSLFDSLEDSAEAEPAPSLVELLLGLERAQLRFDATALRHADFTTLGAPQAAPAELSTSLEPVSANELAPGLAQLISRANTSHGIDLVSSLWVRSGADWRVRFRQFSVG